LIAFQFPGMPGEPPPKATTYVKRLIGLPGELVAVQRGKLFILPAEEAPPRAGLPDDEPAFRFGPDEQAQELFAKGKFRLLRKPPAQVLALRRLVHDSRHTAVDLAGPEYRRWVAAEASGWADEGPGFRHNGKADAVTWLRYRHVLRNAPDRPQLITDFMGYNTWQGGAGHHQAPQENWAGDLMLECEAEVGPQGSLYLELSRGEDRFQARFDLEKETCALLRLARGNGPVVLKQAGVSLPRSAGVRLRFANVDERLIVWVDDHLPFGDGVGYDGPRKLVPHKKPFQKWRGVQ
jgi:signal peptidase I